MQDLTNELARASSWAIPVFAILTGLISSAHCLGMCGGLILASTKTPGHQISYHSGRYLGYLTITLLASSLGPSISLLKIPALNIFLGVLVGVGLIMFGLKSYIPVDPFQLFAETLLKSPSQKIIANSRLRSIFHQSFLIGVASAFLPCGVLWGVVLALMGTQDSVKAVLGITFFWAGTLPALAIAPMGLHHLLKSKANNLAHLINISFMAIGIITILLKIQGPIQSLRNTGASPSEEICH